MALQDTSYLKIGGKPLRFANELAYTRPWAMENQTAGYYLPNQDTDNGESSADALNRAGKNRAPGSNQGAEARRFVLDTGAVPRTPTPNGSYWRGKNGVNGNTPMQTDLVDTADVNGAATNVYVAYVVCAMHKADAALLTSGANSGDMRATVIGSYGNTIYGGWTLEFSSPVLMRLITYDMVLGVRSVNLGLPGTATDANPGDGLPGPWVEADLLCDLWRILRVDVLTDKIIGTNVTGDSGVDTVEVTTPNGRRASGQPISLFGRVAPLSATNYQLGCSLMLADIKTAVPTTDEHNTTVAQVREQMRFAGISELTSIG